MFAQGLPATFFTVTIEHGGIGVGNGYFFFGLSVSGLRRFAGRRKRECLFLWGFIILEAERIAGGASDAARVVVEKIFEVVFVLGIFEAWRIRIGNEGVKREWRDCVSMGGVKVHVFREAIGVEKIIARPAVGKLGQIRRIKINGDLIARAVNHIFFVNLSDEVGNIAVARVVSDLSRVRTCGAHLLVDVAQIIDGIAFDDARLAVEIELRGGQRNLGDLERNIARRIIDANPVPVNLQVRRDANKT